MTSNLYGGKNPSSEMTANMEQNPGGDRRQHGLDAMHI